jgi:hypothetical protein
VCFRKVAFYQKRVIEVGVLVLLAYLCSPLAQRPRERGLKGSKRSASRCAGLPRGCLQCRRAPVGQRTAEKHPTAKSDDTTRQEQTN